jgi:hypothetical protein
MEELIKAIKDWPIIIQGVLGSAIFWALLGIGGYATNKITLAYSKRSTKARLNWLINEQAKCFINSSKTNEEMNAHILTLFYRASLSSLKAAMWLAMGLLLQSLIEPAGAIGFAGAIYYLLNARETLEPNKKSDYSSEREKQIEEEIKELESKIESTPDGKPIG